MSFESTGREAKCCKGAESRIQPVDVCECVRLDASRPEQFSANRAFVSCRHDPQPPGKAQRFYRAVLLP